MDVNGGQLEVIDIAGQPAWAPVVLLHSGAGSVAGWRDFPERLAEATGRRVVAYSRLGHGQSAPLRQVPGADFMHREARTTLPALLQQMRIDRCALVGHSDGASIATIFAAEFSERIPALVLMAGHYFVEDETLDAIRAAGDRYRHSGPPSVLVRIHADPEAAFRAWHDVWLSPAFRSMDLRSTLRLVRCSILVMQGVDDEFSSKAQVDSVATNAAGAVTTVMVPGGHFPHTEAAVETLDAVVRFLRLVA